MKLLANCEDKGPGTSNRKEDTSDLFENAPDSRSTIMRSKVENLLKENGFHRGITLTDLEIQSSISILRKNPSIFDLHVEYKNFLKTYGSIYGKGLNIYGPIDENYTGHKVDDVVRTQNGFINFGKAVNIGLELEFCWAVAFYNSDFYYIDSSNIGKGYIYRVGFNGSPEIFVENFLDFLDNISTRYKLEELDLSP